MWINLGLPQLWGKLIHALGYVDPSSKKTMLHIKIN